MDGLEMERVEGMKVEGVEVVEVVEGVEREGVGLEAVPSDTGCLHPPYTARRSI